MDGNPLEGLIELANFFKERKRSKDAAASFLSKIENIDFSATVVTICLTPMTRPEEWDVDISVKHELGGRTILVPINIPEPMVKAIEYKYNKEQVDGILRELGYLVALEGVRSFATDKMHMENLIKSMVKAAENPEE